jgi:3-hydroxy-3-methylglutaryl CoA synthase
MKPLQAKNCGISCLELYIPKTYVDQEELGKFFMSHFAEIFDGCVGKYTKGLG